jgi:hypothetical protein
MILLYLIIFTFVVIIIKVYFYFTTIIKYKLTTTIIENETYNFPPTLYINLDKNENRDNKLKNEFSKWPSSPERISAIKHIFGWMGCAASHIKCIKIAKERNYPWVLVIEDDCKLSSSALDTFQKILPYLWNNKNKWDIFNGGPIVLKNITRISNNPQLFDVYGMSCHFCLINSFTYDKIITNNIVDKMIPIDVTYANKLRIWSTVPHIATQYEGQSDIIHCVTNHTNKFEESNSLLLQIPFIN